MPISEQQFIEALESIKKAGKSMLELRPTEIAEIQAVYAEFEKAAAVIDLFSDEQYVRILGEPRRRLKT